MKKLIIKAIIASAFIFVIVINLSVNQKSQEQDISLVMKNVEALADGEGGECTRTCFLSECNAVWEDVNCKVECGSTNCNFSYAEKN